MALITKSEEEPRYIILNPNKTVAQKDINVFRTERDYFDSLTLNDVT